MTDSKQPKVGEEAVVSGVASKSEAKQAEVTTVESNPDAGPSQQQGRVNSSTESQHHDLNETPEKISWSQRLNPLKRRTAFPVPEHRDVSHEYQANILSKVYFHWMVPLLAVGYQRPLELNDIWEVNPDRQVDIQAAKFKSALSRRGAVKSRIDPLVLALYDTFKTDFIIGGLCQLTAGCIQVLSPFVLKYLINFVQDAYNTRFIGTPPSIGNGIGLAVGIALMQIVQSLCMNHFYYCGMILGGQARSVLIACVFEKTTKLSGRAKAGDKDNEEGWSNGRINNLMSTDTSRIDSASSTLHRCWVAPIQVVLALALLCINLGYSALVGFAVICIVTPLLGRAIKLLMAQRKAINKLTDQRIRSTQEIFNAIRSVKLFAWEPKLLSRLSSIREIEINKIAYLLNIRNAILATAGILPIIASMLTFITYTLSNHELSAGPVFSSLALFNSLGVPLEVFPLAIGRIVDAMASVRRISQFLEAEEISDQAVWDSHQTEALVVKDAAWVWERTTERKKVDSTNSKPAADAEAIEPQHIPFSIRGIDLSVGRKEFIAVIGTVGSGKSSLISALAGDMRQAAGSVCFGASRALCSQTPWIQNTTLRHNITFGKDYDKAFYKSVIGACALGPDIDMLPSGDETEIGEKGVTLSGGQKQRVNIARAIYFNAEIVLMDDPLSAVDAHVGQHILDHAICGLLKDKCRILVTHQLHLLHRADRIVWMKDGRVYKTAIYQQLIEDDLEFQTIIHTFGRKEEAADSTTTKDKQAEAKEEVIQPTKKPVALMQQEDRANGTAGFSVYIEFVRASGTVLNFLFIVAVLSLAQGANIITSLWLSWWTSNRFAGVSTGSYIGVYVALGVLQALLMFGYATTLTTVSTRAGKNMLNNAMSHTIRAPMAFFDTTPIGRIMNRFSKDVDSIDNRLTDNFRFLLFIIASFFAVFSLAIAYFYYFAVALAPLIIAFLFAASYYRASAREIKRHEAVLRSVVFAQFGEAIPGTATIRAFGAQQRFIDNLSQALDSMNGAYFLTFAGQRWLSIRLDTLGSLLIFVVAILIVTSRFVVNPAISGLILSYMLSIVALIQIVVHIYADVQNDMNSVERLQYYGHGLEQEESSEDKQAIRQTWPEKGELQFKNVQMRYRHGLPLVLKGLDLSIKSGERIGIVGRTGAGKSSIISALFRLVELSSGSITIDGMNIAAIPLHDLRSRLSIIPQDPTLFRGTVRSNLDPFEEHDDARLWNALRQAGLLEGEVSSSEAEGKKRMTLDSPIEDEGLNYSLGERQLLALARILVKDSQIVMFDEATSSVDFETDRKVQRTVLKAFNGKTLLCIAHRLMTIIGYDRVLVMDAGVVAEFDSPLALFDQRGIFHSMCARSGISRADISGEIGSVEADN